MRLQLGCGRRPKQTPDEVTLDADPLLKPDVVCTLGVDPLPFPDDSVDLAIAIHVLEHIGKQGEIAEWFQFWEELYRVLKPGGSLQFEAPWFESPWAWGDPSHVRALPPFAFAFFDQDTYRIPDSSVSPYRIRCDFVSSPFWRVDDTNFRGILTARKPLKPWWEA